MRIMVVNSLYFPHRVGGAEISVQILCEGLVSQSHQVRVLTLHKESYRQYSVINGVEVVYLPLKNIYWPFDNKRRSGFSRGLWHLIDSYNPISRVQFGKELDMYKPDLIHTNNLSGFSISVWSAAKNRGIKIVHTARDYYLFHPNSTLFEHGKNQSPRSFGVLSWSLFRRFHSRKVSSFIGISEFIEKFHVDNGFFSLCRTSCIYNAVMVLPSETQNVDCLRIGFIGKLNTAKGFDVFCQFSQSIKSESRNVITIAAGDYSYDEILDLEALAAKAQVKVLGRICLSDFLSMVDVVILPTKWREPFGRTVIECALANKVVLVNSVGGITELLKIVPTIFELNKGLTFDKLRAIMNEKHVVGSQVRAVFSSEKITQEYIAEYDRVKNGY